jgi:hypothetical protein
MCMTDCETEAQHRPAERSSFKFYQAFSIPTKNSRPSPGKYR